MNNRPAELWAYIGTYTQPGPYTSGSGEGIYLYQFDLTSGALTSADHVASAINPSFLTIDPKRLVLYCVNEEEFAERSATNGVSAFRIDAESGKLTYINFQPTQGAAACHLMLDTTGRYLIVANYLTGSICVLPILENGGIGPISDFVQHVGSSVNPERQQSPHPHSINQDATTGLIYVPDLGIDKILLYELDAANGKLRSCQEQPSVQVHSGAGPRHLAFHPHLNIVYVVNELNLSVTVFAKHPARGTLTELQNVSGTPEGFTEGGWAADIHVHPNGSFVYTSIRSIHAEYNSIATFVVEEGSGKLTPLAHIPTGFIPRNFAVDPTGTFLVVANQLSDDIYVFRLMENGRKLLRVSHSAASNSVEVGNPACIKFLSR